MLFSRLLRTGISPDLDRLETGRVIVLNNFAFFLSCISLVMTFVALLESLWFQSLSVAIGFCLFSATFFIISKGKYQLAKWYLLIVGVLTILGVANAAYNQSLFTDIENLLFGMMVLAMFLFDRHFRSIIYWALFGLLVLMKAYREGFIDNTFDKAFFLLIQNTSILAVILFVFLRVYNQTLQRTLMDIVKQDHMVYSLIDNISPFVTLIDKEGKFMLVNKQYERAFGVPRNEIQGSSAHEILPEHLADGQDKVVEQVLKTKERVEFKESRTMPDGSINVGHGKFSPILNEHGEVLFVAGYVNNISQLEMTKEKLRKANKTKNKLLSIVAHDIRSPIIMLESLVGAFKDNLMSKEEFDQYLNSVEAKFTPLKEMVGDLLEWSRSQMDELSVEAETFDPSEEVEAAISYYKIIAEEKGVKLTADVSAKAITFDSNHLKVVIRNIVQNAIKFTKKGGSVEVRVTEEHGQSTVEIEDTGSGMSQDLVDKILNKEMIDSKLGTEGEKGSGLGLNLIIDLIQKNAYKIGIESTVGKGTIFRLSPK